MRVGSSLLLFSFILLLPRAVDAQDSCGQACRFEARSLFQDGMAALGREQADEAVELLRQSLVRLPLTATAFNLALALRAADDPREALSQLDELLALRYGPLSEQERASVLFIHDQVKDEVGRLRLTLRGPDRARLRLSDDITLEVTSRRPSTLSLNPGDITLHLESPGFRTEQQIVPLIAGETLALEVSMELEAHREEVARPLRRSPWLWVAVTLVVLGSALTLGLLLRDRSDPIWGTAEVGLSMGR